MPATSAPKPNRSLGDHLLELEVILDAMVDEHDLQWGDIFGLVYSHLMVHRPDAREEYADDGSHPVAYYGHADSVPCKICNGGGRFERGKKRWNK